jgi:hypothetical protein
MHAAAPRRWRSGANDVLYIIKAPTRGKVVGCCATDDSAQKNRRPESPCLTDHLLPGVTFKSTVEQCVFMQVCIQNTLYIVEQMRHVHML